MKILTICGLIAAALLSATLLRPFVQSPSGDRPEHGIFLSDLGRQSSPQKPTEITDYSVEFRQESHAPQQ